MPFRLLCTLIGLWLFALPAYSAVLAFDSLAPGLPFAQGAMYSITVDCRTSGGVATQPTNGAFQTAVIGSPVQFLGLSVNTTCSYTHLTPTVPAGKTGQFVPPIGETYSVTLESEEKRLTLLHDLFNTETVTIRSQITAPADFPGVVIPITIACEQRFPNNKYVRYFSNTKLQIASSTSATVENVPAGSACSVAVDQSSLEKAVSAAGFRIYGLRVDKSQISGSAFVATIQLIAGKPIAISVSTSTNAPGLVTGLLELSCYGSAYQSYQRTVENISVGTVVPFSDVPPSTRCTARLIPTSKAPAATAFLTSDFDFFDSSSEGGTILSITRRITQVPTFPVYFSGEINVPGVNPHVQILGNCKLAGFSIEFDKTLPVLAKDLEIASAPAGATCSLSTFPRQDPKGYVWIGVRANVAQIKVTEAGAPSFIVRGQLAPNDASIKVSIASIGIPPATDVVFSPRISCEAFFAYVNPATSELTSKTSVRFINVPSDVACTVEVAAPYPPRGYIWNTKPPVDSGFPLPTYWTYSKQITPAPGDNSVAFDVELIPSTSIYVSANLVGQVPSQAWYAVVNATCTRAGVTYRVDSGVDQFRPTTELQGVPSDAFCIVKITSAYTVAAVRASDIIATPVSLTTTTQGGSSVNVQFSFGREADVPTVREVPVMGTKELIALALLLMACAVCGSHLGIKGLVASPSRSKRID
jgi:hypothetical protein